MNQVPILGVRNAVADKSTGKWQARLVRSIRLAVGFALVPTAMLTTAGFSGPDHQARTAVIAPPGDWAKARQVPGTEAMSMGSVQDDGKAFASTGITSADCRARGECAVSGGFVDAGFNFLLFTASEHDSKWARAQVVPGDAALVANGAVASDNEVGAGSFLSQVSCSSPGNCGLAGNYQIPPPSEQTAPLFSTEKAGTWQDAHPLSGFAFAAQAISCPPQPGNCAAGGIAHTGPLVNDVGGFVVAEKGGRWGKPQLVAGTSEPVSAISCPTAGNCLAGGFGRVAGDSTGPQPFGTAFLVMQEQGKWGKRVRVVPGLSLLSKGHTGVDSISCPTAGNCLVGGTYTDSSGHVQVYVAQERSGVWGKAQPMPGLSALNRGGQASLSQVSCGKPGYCTAGGSYLSDKRPLRQQAWVATELGGTWGKAREVPGTAGLNTANRAIVTSVSCTPTSCAVGGRFITKSHRERPVAFLATEQGSSWHNAARVPGLSALDPRPAAT